MGWFKLWPLLFVLLSEGKQLTAFHVHIPQKTDAGLETHRLPFSQSPLLLF